MEAGGGVGGATTCAVQQLSRSLTLNDLAAKMPN